MKKKYNTNNNEISLSNIHKAISENKQHYAYILASYLGDGYISKMPRTYSIRIPCDIKYPEISARQKISLDKLFTNSVHIYIPKNDNVNIVTMYNNLLPDIFPQHGDGLKHTRDVSLHDWQQEIVNCEPECFLIGLIDTDGCEYYHTQTVGGKERSYKMYMFTNMSSDIIKMFCETLKVLDIDHRLVHYKNGKINVYVSKRSEVLKIDTIYKIAINKLEENSNES